MAEGCCKERGDGARKGGEGKEEDQKTGDINKDEGKGGELHSTQT